MKFTARHKARRELLGLTQKDVAEALKLSRGTISAYERDELGHMSEFMVNGIKTYYDKLTTTLNLSDKEKRLLKIAENAICAWYEDREIPDHTR